MSGALSFCAGDGTTGTVPLKDIRTGALSSFPQQLTAVGTQLFFIANDGTHGTELWVSDGSATGTALVKEYR